MISLALAVVFGATIFAAALAVGYSLGERSSSSGVDPAEHEELRQNYRRLGAVVHEFVSENEAVHLNDPALVSRARGALQSFYKRELGE